MVAEAIAPAHDRVVGSDDSNAMLFENRHGAAEIVLIVREGLVGLRVGVNLCLGSDERANERRPADEGLRG